MELCSVPVFTQLKKFIDGKKRVGYIWDHIDEKWVQVDSKQLRPGLTVLLPASAGGYSDELGWDMNAGRVQPLPPLNSSRPEGVSSDDNTTIPAKLTIAEHTNHVCAKLAEITAAIGLRKFDSVLGQAALWHDVGKAHPICQQAQRAINASLDENEVWAKSGSRGRLVYKRGSDRVPFRHELASALVAVQHKLPFLVAYLIAAHHGKVRLSIRSLPGEPPPHDPQTLFALGVHHGDELPEVQLEGAVVPATKLDLKPMQLGGDCSWTARALNLLAEFGPFRLAYLEAILRIADQSASNEEASHAQ